jgi:hypothetical protein
MESVFDNFGGQKKGQRTGFLYDFRQRSTSTYAKPRKAALPAKALQ